MKLPKTSIYVIALLVLMLCHTSLAQIVDKSLAETVADNWIKTVIISRGSWGGLETASVDKVIEFKRGDRVVGYFCHVEPQGHIIVSLIEGMPPIKAYSETSSLDPFSEEGPADLLKGKMEGALDFIESRAGKIDNLTRAELEQIPELDRFDTWELLKAGPVDNGIRYDKNRSGGDYQMGDILIEANWHQGDPYYLLCPTPPILSGCTAPHCAVGCVATAGAMILRYWSWPQGQNAQDWLNMPDATEISPTPEEIAAVSQISHDLGVALNMEYCQNGCGSGAGTDEMTAIYHSLGYTGCSGAKWRSDYTYTQWWNMIVHELSYNRPMQYRILKHSIICDGWYQYIDPEIHMNYGWADSYNAWYFLDQLYQVGDGTTDDEYLLRYIYPYTSLDSPIFGTYPYVESYNPRFIYRDIEADSVDFLAGQAIHFHRNKIMKCRSGWLNFYGSPTANTTLYTGDFSRGIKIRDGYILMYPGAEIKFRLDRPD